MSKFWKWLGIALLITAATFGIGLIIWGIVALIRKVRDS
jgi:hypothetical protein